MDQRFRQLERQWQSTGEPALFERLLAELLRQHSHEEWERLAETGDAQALSYIDAIRHFIDDDLDQSEVYVNAYEDFTARSAIHCSLSQITEVRRWLRTYYADHNLFYSGRELYDISLQQTVNDPAAQFVVETSISPCFRMTPGEINQEAQRLGINLNLDYENGEVSPALLRRLCPINRWGQRDHYVGFTIIGDYATPTEDETSVEIRDRITAGYAGHASVQVTNPQLRSLPHWVNIYETTRQYGGAEEGGWWFNVDYPISTIYVGNLIAEVSDAEDGEGPLETPTLSIYQGAAGNTVRSAYGYDEAEVPAHVQPAVDFATQMYEDLTEGDIYSASGGRYISINLQTHPAVRDPFCRPYYC